VSDYCIDFPQNFYRGVLEGMADAIRSARTLKIYSVGAIDRANDGGVTWRRALGERLRARGHVLLDPTAKASQSLAATAKAALAKGDVGTARKAMTQIRNDDLAMLVACDWVLAYIDPSQSPCGSYMELVYARSLGKPVYVVIAGGVTRCPLWLLTEFDVHDSFDAWFAARAA
jgi:hypothetical protein